MALPSSDRLATDLRTLRLIWLAVALGVVVATAVVATLVLAGHGGAGLLAPDLPFYLAAIASVASILVAFHVQRRLIERVLPETTGYAAAARAVRLHAIISIAVMETGAFFAAVMAFLAGELMPLAFVVPFFAFSWLFAPTADRFAFWLSRTPLGRDRPDGGL